MTLMQIYLRAHDAHINVRARLCRCSLYRRYFWILHQRHAMLLQCETTELLRKTCKTTHASPPSTVLSRRESDAYMRCVMSHLHATISLYYDSLRHQGRTKRGNTPTGANVTMDWHIELRLRMQRTTMISSTSD